MKKSYLALGVMAGSSMDGLDIALTNFTKVNGRWNFDCLQAITLDYDLEVKQALKKSPDLSLEEKKALDDWFGKWIGNKIRNFIHEQKKNIQLVSVHGHTVIHSPKNKISWQLGNGQTIANTLNITTVSDFRTQDILQGGQGAPLVPYGDFNLFSEYDACLNLGGIANISFKKQKNAWDICPCNQLLNFYANQLGLDYDEGGRKAKQGKIDDAFLMALESNEYFDKPSPKSLANDLFPLQLLRTVPPKDGLHTSIMFIARQIAKNIPVSLYNILVTGGGVFNTFLVSEIDKLLPNTKMIIPDDMIISFKEAIIFAFLGILRLHKEINVLATVTGADKDTSSGKIYQPI